MSERTGDGEMFERLILRRRCLRVAAGFFQEQEKGSRYWLSFCYNISQTHSPRVRICGLTLSAQATLQQVP
jgi:putative SOS response-associated peptidase YedK